MVKKLTWLFLILSFIFIGCNIATTYIPKEVIYENALKSCVAIDHDVKHGGPIRFFGCGSAFTDGIMLNIVATQSGPDCFGEAIAGKVYMLGKGAPETAAAAAAKILTEGGTENMPSFLYGRYWHGYMLCIKCMLMFFDYYTIQIIGAIVYLLLLAALLVLTKQKLGWRVCLMFLFSQMFFMVPCAMVGLTNSTCFFLSYVGCIVLLLFPREYLYNPRVTASLFFVLGALTCYLDFLRTPVLTLGFPLAYLLLLQNKCENITDVLKTLFVTTTSWGVSYALFWGVKWLLVCAVVPEQTPIIDAAVARFYFGIFEGKLLLRTCCILLLSFTYLIGAFAFVRVCMRTVSHMVGCAVAFLYVAFLPMAWASVLINHTTVHAGFTYRIYSLAVFALMVLAEKFYSKSCTNA